MNYNKVIDNYIMDRANFIDIKGLNFIKSKSFSNKISYPITREDSKEIVETGIIKFSNYLKGIIILFSIKGKTKYAAKLPVYKSILKEFFSAKDDYDIMDNIHKSYMSTCEWDNFNEMVIGRALYNMGLHEEYFLNKLSKLYFNISTSEKDTKISAAFDEANENILKELYENSSTQDKDFYLGKIYHKRNDIENASKFMKRYMKSTKNQVKIDAAKSYIFSGYMQKAYIAVKHYESTLDKYSITEVIEDLKTLLEMNFMIDEIYTNIAKLYLKIGELDMALENIDIALENNKDNIEAIMMKTMIKKLN
jgi:tetratricopeptide (TPR) repeat protein